MKDKIQGKQRIKGLLCGECRKEEIYFDFDLEALACDNCNTVWAELWSRVTRVD